MSKTFCGKSCEECLDKKDLNCPGCRLGPAQTNGCSCDIAQCCRSRGNESCDVCNFKVRCDKYARRNKAPSDRQLKMKRQKYELDRVDEVAEFTPLAARWMRILLWLVIPNMIGSFFTNETIRQYLPGLYIPGTILELASNIGYCFVLFRMSALLDRYRKAGICVLILNGISILSLLTANVSGAAFLYSLLIVPTIVISFVAMYQEYYAHSELLAEVDVYVSEKWITLWKGTVLAYCVTYGSILLLAFRLMLLGLIAVIVGSLGIVILSIAKLVLLHQSVKKAEVYTVMANNE